MCCLCEPQVQWIFELASTLRGTVDTAARFWGFQVVGSSDLFCAFCGVGKSQHLVVGSWGICGGRLYIVSIWVGR